MSESVSGSEQEHWSGKAAFILAAVGSAVGLGNLVRFPSVAGSAGGGAFVLVYFLCVVLIALPVLIAELFIGRRGGGSAVSAVARLAKAEGNSSMWSLFCWIGMIASFMIVTFYSVLAGWVLDFVVLSFSDLMSNISANGIGAISNGAFAGMDDEEITGQLGALLESPVKMIVMLAIFNVITVFIVSRGVKGGIETAAKVMMPAFFALLLVLTVFSIINGDAGSALSFLFKPDMGKFMATLSDGSILLQAVGQAFFSLSLGSAMMITYGLYMGRDQDLPGSARIVAVADTSVALIAGLAIFPIVFAAGLNPDGGLTLLFSTFPLALHQIPFGGVLAIAIFLMTLFAALTSAIALLEVAVAFADGDLNLTREQRKRRRLVWSVLLGILMFVIGVGHVLSQVPTSVQDNFFNTWTPLDFIPMFEGKTLLDTFDKLSGDVLLPLGGFLTAIFAGWVMSSSSAREEIRFNSERTFRIWRFLVRWVCPLFVGLVLIYAVIVAPLRAQMEARGSDAKQTIEEMAAPKD
ncbi:sodium-dependent transporter [Parvularcula sp. LCG005]|uniref:sodium-dependent transporter n=1 Tax=Parvularcula sp. LCG005 TaxID=3078805 RepID=UPI00294284A4|nr:sodium-dependent transporter [Parvularcula sp. LCG005]WOI54120.1 sodium-dependent transporter [Parvularcula sp. LCG005]